MNSTTTIIHILRSNIRQHRLYLAAYLIVTLAVVVVEHFSPSRASLSLLTAMRVFQFGAFILLTAQVFLTDSASDTTSHWWARPIGRASLLTAKIVYVVLTLWLPLLIASAIAWQLDDYSLRQTLLAGAELSLYALGIGVLAGGIAAISSHFWSFLTRALLIILGMFTLTWIAMVSGWLDFMSAHGPWTAGSGTVVSVVFLTFAAMGAVCLISVYFARKPWWRHVAILVLVVSPVFLSPSSRFAHRDDPVISSGQPVAFGPPGNSATQGASEHILLGNIAVHDLPENHSISPIRAQLRFQDRDGREADLVFQSEYQWEARFGLPNEAADDLLERILPPDLRLLNSNVHSRRHQLQSNVPEGLNLDEAGRLSGNLQYGLLEWSHLGAVPLQSGASVAEKGHRLRINDVQVHDHQVMLRVGMKSPSLLWSNEPTARRRGPRSMPLSAWVCLIRYPSQGYAAWSMIRPHSHGSLDPLSVVGFQPFDLHFPGFQAFPRPEEQLQLHVYRIELRGVFDQALDWDGHRLRTTLDSSPASRAPRSVAGVPADFGEVKTVDDLAAFPLSFDYWERHDVEERSEEIIASDLSRALDRVPWPLPQHRALLLILGDTSFEDLPANFDNALRTDRRLMAIVEKQGGAERFRDQIIDELGRRQPSTDPAVVRMAAGFSDPALYDDLKWHFLHNRLRDRTFYPALKDLPGLDARALLVEAWPRALVTSDWHDLIIPALREGLPEAVPYAVRYLFLEGTVTDRRHSRVLRAFMEVTRSQESPEAFYGWITDHADALVFDPETGTYNQSGE